MSPRPLKDDENVVPLRNARPLRPDEAVVSEPISSTFAQRAGRQALGAGELGLTLATSAFSQPLAGLAGLSDTATGFILGEEDPVISAAATVRSIEDAMTYSPRTAEGQRILGQLADLTRPITKVIDEISDAADRTGGPAFAAQIRALIEGAPAIVGMKGLRGIPGRARDIRRFEQAAKERGIDVRAAGGEQRAQITQAGEASAGQLRGESLPEVQRALATARIEARDAAGALFDEARAFRAGVPVPEARPLPSTIRRSLADFDIDDMPKVQRRLAELDEFMGAAPDSASVRLQSIDNFRRRIDKNRPPRADATQNRALDIMKAELDNWLDAQFDADMISGSPLAVTKWKEARVAWGGYKERFFDDKIIRRMWENSGTPEEMRSWLFGASQMGFSVKSGGVIGRLKNILGEDSVHMMALRQDAMLNIVDPLLQDAPNFTQFIRNHGKLVRGHDTLMNELFLPDQLSNLEELVKFARAATRLQPDEAARLGAPMERILSTALFGHGIAKAGLRQRIAQRVIKLMVDSGSRRNRQVVMAEFLGYDPKQPLIGTRPVIATGAVQPIFDEAREPQTTAP